MQAGRHYDAGMHPAPTRPTRMVLTRRGRLVRTILVLLVVIALVVSIVLGIRTLRGGEDDPAGAPGQGGSAASDPTASDAGGAEPSDAGGDAGSPTPEAEPELAGAEETTEPGPGLRTTRSGIIRSDTVGDGTWTVAAPAAPTGEAAATVHRYAVRVEGGLGITADDAAQEVARILGDERGWTTTEDVGFEQVADPAQAEFTISIASPPTADQLCLPARTQGIWSCRVGPDVVLNSDRWIHMTPTYSEIGEYRAYMVNHEVGHFLGHGHESCAGEGLAAPVMMQQSKGLAGCRPNAWPTADGNA